jgi:type VI protein secretion system component VasF
MFDIDRYLDDITLKEMQPDEDVINRTKKRCEEEQQKLRKKKEALKNVRKGAMIAVPAAAVLLIGVFLGAVLFSKTTIEQPQQVAYYT